MRGAKKPVSFLRLPKKSQITLIVIVGLMLAIIFVFLLSLRKPDSPKATVSPDRILHELDSGLVKDHITSCIYSLASKGIERLGSDGGYIYNYDGGSVPLDLSSEGLSFINYTKGQRTFFVAYGLRENGFCSLLDYSVPAYPHNATLKISDLPSLYSSDVDCIYNHTAAEYDGFFGQNTLPKLCAFMDGKCKVFAKGERPGLTMEHQLDDYIVSKLPLCVNLSSFGEQFNADVSQNGNITVRAVIRDKDIQLSVDYPFKITFSGQIPITKVVQYQSVVKVRLGAIYNFLFDMLSRESIDLQYNSSYYYPTSSYYLPGFVFRKIDDPCPSCPYPYRFDDIFEVADTQSILDGLPFIFRTAVQERMPALDYINSSLDYDIVQDPGSFVTVPIIAVAPDNSSFKYLFLSDGFNGWVEDTSPILLLGSGPTLKIPLTRNDYGIHHAAILVYTKAGLFDFQDFVINVSGDPGNQVDAAFCLPQCAPVFGVACNSWCWLAANMCGDPVFDTDAASIIRQCVDPILKAEWKEEPPYHPVDCKGLSKSTCIQSMPDCFWIVQTVGGSFIESCVNDWDLSTAVHPAFIIDS
jgi:hypothetical protein